MIFRFFLVIVDDPTSEDEEALLPVLDDPTPTLLAHPSLLDGW